MARLRRPEVRVAVGVPPALLNPFLPLWKDDARVQKWRSAHGLRADRWAVRPGHRRRHGVALSDWAVLQGLVNDEGDPDWRRLRPLLREERNTR